MRNSKDEPDLDPPGAGLPLLELWIGRIHFRKTAKQDRKTAREKFEGELARINKILESGDEGDFEERVLIKRIRGIEDSSRFWSVLMVLDHLKIVNDLIGVTITSLGEGKVPDSVVGIADVKPDQNVTTKVIGEFQDSCGMVLKGADKVADLATPERFIHPWFGPLNAHEWLVIAGIHMRIHRCQIQKILEGLP